MPDGVAHSDRIGTRSNPYSSAPDRYPPNDEFVPAADATIASPSANPAASKAAKSVRFALKTFVSWESCAAATRGRGPSDERWAMSGAEPIGPPSSSLIRQPSSFILYPSRQSENRAGVDRTGDRAVELLRDTNEAGDELCVALRQLPLAVVEIVLQSGADVTAHRHPRDPER